MSTLSEEEKEAQRQKDLEEGRMAFSAHIRELQVRVRNSVLGMIVGFIASIAFTKDIFVFLAAPLVDAYAQNPKLGDPSFYFTGLLQPFWTFFSLAFWASIFLSSPIIFYQIWKFVAPGLYQSERRWGILFALGSAVFFAGGATFCYLVVLPAVCEFLLGYATESISDVLDAKIALQPLLTMNEFVDLAKKLLIGFGLIFELPLLILVLALVGLVTHRSLWRFNRWSILLAFVVSAMLTPPDIYSQLLMAGPLIVLYNFSIILAFFVTTRREAKERRDSSAS